MKNFFYFRLLFLCLLPVALFCACKKQQVAMMAYKPTILQYIAADSQLTLLDSAITRCHLDTVFASGGPFTFFCPVNSAFIAAGLTADSIARYNPDSLSRVLRYQLLSGKFSSADLLGFVTESVTSLDSLAKPFITKNYFGIFLNGISVTQGDIELGDGVIQKTAKVAFPPNRTLLQLIDSLPELSYFKAVVNLVPNFKNNLSEFYYNIYGLDNSVQVDSGHTVLAPTNAAFQQSAYPTIAIINQQNPSVLNAIWGSFIMDGFLFTSNFMGGFVPGVAGTNAGFKIAYDGTTIIPNYPVGVPPQITVSNIICTDGVIQEMDQVFLAAP